MKFINLLIVVFLFNTTTSAANTTQWHAEYAQVWGVLLASTSFNEKNYNDTSKLTPAIKSLALARYWNIINYYGSVN